MNFPSIILHHINCTSAIWITYSNTRRLIHHQTLTIAKRLCRWDIFAAKASEPPI